ncbi:MAG: DUF6883 domain-containing protein [Planktothrix sp.]|uniref:DUF6883 domain-containing protein n=1 Tax=Planktothrix sp. TaxID=3088171 RepID=UPI0038D4E90C
MHCLFLWHVEFNSVYIKFRLTTRFNRKLPNPENTIVDDQKLTGYCLNITHGEGQHKARIFKSALDLD